MTQIKIFVLLFSLAAIAMALPQVDTIVPEEDFADPKVSVAPDISLAEASSEACTVSQWSKWSDCSKDCNGGVKQRHRTISHVTDKTQCPELNQSAQCNVGACDHESETRSKQHLHLLNHLNGVKDDFQRDAAIMRDVQLMISRKEDDHCSLKALNSDSNDSERFQAIISQYEGLLDQNIEHVSNHIRHVKHTGQTATNLLQKNSSTRSSSPSLNLQQSTERRQCRKKGNLVILLDGSGSIGKEGFKAQQDLALKLVDAFPQSETKISVLSVAGPSTWYLFYLCTGRLRGRKAHPRQCGIQTVSPLSSDREAIKKAIKGMGFSPRSYFLSVGLKTVQSMLDAVAGDDDGDNAARRVANQVVVILDGRPLSSQLTHQASVNLRKVANVMYVGVGKGISQGDLVPYSDKPLDRFTFQVDNWKDVNMDTVTKIAAIRTSSLCTFLDKTPTPDRFSVYDSRMSKEVAKRKNNPEGAAKEGWRIIYDLTRNILEEVNESHDREQVSCKASIPIAHDQIDETRKDSRLYKAQISSANMDHLRASGTISTLDRSSNRLHKEIEHLKKTEDRLLGAVFGVNYARNLTAKVLKKLAEPRDILRKRIDKQRNTLDAMQTALAEATYRGIQAREGHRRTEQKLKALEEELEEIKGQCSSDDKSAKSSQCALRKIRGELMKSSHSPRRNHVRDCEVSEWESGYCNKRCRKSTRDKMGYMNMTREVATPPSQTGGLKCPTLAVTESCGAIRCRMDCIITDWSQWEPCSEPCGGGVRVRVRSIRRTARFGGEPCGAALETEPCNPQSCDY